MSRLQILRKGSAGCRGRKIALDVARGLHYLHSNSVIHFECALCLSCLHICSRLLS